MNRTDRLHAIDEALRRAGARGITAARLADDLEVSVRTIKRDVSALQQAGSLIWSQPGPGGGYVLDASASLPPVAFTPAQAVSMAAALALLPPGSPFAVDARAAVAKVVDTLGEGATERADELAGRVWVLRDEAERSPKPSVVRAIERSLTEHRVLTMTYRAPGRAPTRRTVEPVIAAWGYGRWYLVAYCRERRAIRWFRFARIERADVGGERYEPRPVADIGEPPAGAEAVGGEAGRSG